MQDPGSTIIFTMFSGYFSMFNVQCLIFNVHWAMFNAHPNIMQQHRQSHLQCATCNAHFATLKKYASRYWNASRITFVLCNISEMCNISEICIQIVKYFRNVHPNIKMHQGPASKIRLFPSFSFSWRLHWTCFARQVGIFPFSLFSGSNLGYIFYQAQYIFFPVLVC